MGHTTQSLALRFMLEKNGHEVVNSFIGTNVFSGKNPFYKSLHHESFFSPVLLNRTNKKGINLFTSFCFNLIISPVYLFSIFRIAYRIRTSDANAVIVFYDFIGQLGSFLSFSRKPVYSVSHHFFFRHPVFTWPEKRKAERWLLKIHSRLASLGARKILALSFTSEESIPSEKIVVVPPLLRPEILYAEAVSGDHVHVYCLHSGFLDIIVSLAIRTPQKKFKVFLHEQDSKTEIPKNIDVLLISGEEFIESLRTCGTVICTAGFETPSEAVYLNKALILIPSEAHFEQYCNALDATRAKAAAFREPFILNELPGYKNNPAHFPFITWIGSAEKTFLKILTE